MATGTTFPGSQDEQRGLTYWMERVLKELEEVRSAPDADAVHDLRVALRRCRSLAAVMEEVDPDPAWEEMRKLGRKLFKQLGELRDTQVLEEWANKLGSENDAVRERLLAYLRKNETEERDAALRAAGKFDAKGWRGYERVLGHRARVVAPNSVAAKSLALERLLAARELHLRALRTEKPEPWHALRIGVKRFRYTVECLLPELYESWGENLKRVQDLLGEVHDLDVLAETIARVAGDEPEEARARWRERIAAERELRLDEYRQLSMGEKRLWQEWKEGLPQGEQLEAAAMARLQATARALGANRGKPGQVTRLALRLYEQLEHLKAGPPFAARQLRKVMQAAARLHGIGAGLRAKSPEKAARKFLRRLPLPVGWTEPEWDLLGLAVRYHRGEEPKAKHKGYARLAKEERQALCAMAGVLRLARMLRKCGVEPSRGLRVERSVDALIVHAPGLEDSEAAAARLAAGKHLLETVLERPLIVRAAPAETKVVELPRPDERVQVAAASD
ncbi:MAG TPA: CHAD domain-containing protein [Candidatus Acidoferrales bacterium]|jgi:CHAD domain-containing protein|nr:CHAD domain-containing protein [Candidatus Acidoferrales bacterium]